ncbi:hypothetical protein F2Q69_00044229 [Brassica cretica]|uniref:Uncharacterized protein n=1 Tax=Brassica cretica TaxID=69181 RepID=A0A8S9NKX1_BRACR|nr:hypothetical protein F2Q69_00044229 [Brassica cretica]
MKMKLAIVQFFMISLLLSSSLFMLSKADSSPCNGKCNVRCSKAGRQDRCLQYCNIFGQLSWFRVRHQPEANCSSLSLKWVLDLRAQGKTSRCDDHCVPSGTYGNRDECPCYRDMKNSKGQPKCP